jgi:hypothetical protein
MSVPYLRGCFKHGGTRGGRAPLQTVEEKASINLVKNERAVSLRRKRRIASDTARPSDSSDGYLTNVWLFVPAVFSATDLFNQKQIDFLKLYRLCVHCFSADNKCSSEGAPDGGIIRDNYTKCTGQLRRMFYDRHRARREFGKQFWHTRDNKLWIDYPGLQRDFKEPVEDLVMSVTSVALLLLKQRLASLNICLAAGFPKLLDLEFMMTPVGAPAQAAHAESRYNFVTMFLALSAPDSGRARKSTWYAKNFEFTFKEFRHDEMRKYEFFQLDLPDGPCFTMSHGGHPHKGPGGLGALKSRYLMFFAFALDEDAMLFGTSEAVHVTLPCAVVFSRRYNRHA